jgi:predicted enzyme related to lactoylglutathione lyase
VTVAASAVLYVTDLSAMRAFYETCFAMVPAYAEQGVCVLASSDWELSLVCVPATVAATLVIADPPRRRAGSPLKLAFDVSELDDAGSRVIAAGGRLDPADGAWEFRGRRYRDCLDPEGNVVQLRQPAQH